MSKKKTVVVNSDLEQRLPLAHLVPLQGDLKVLSDERAKKLRNSILKLGFIYPFFVWENPDTAEILILDGHQRLKVLQSLKDDGYSIPQLPVVFIQADNIKDAKLKLGAAASQFGEFTEQGIAEFFADLEFPELNILEIPHLDVLGLDDSDSQTVTVSEHERSVISKENAHEYTSKIESPVYTPKLDLPPELSTLIDKDKYESLVKQIEKSKLPKELEAFLKISATRHIVFNYENIAEFYCHQDKKTQELMENSALVIIDFNKAIENGFVSMNKSFAEMGVSSNE